MLRSDTQFERATVSQEIRCIVLPEENAPEGSARRVQLLIPSSPKTLISLVPNADKVFGADRSYKMAVAPPGAAIVFWLRPGQGIYAAANEGKSEVTVIVEYHDRERG